MGRIRLWYVWATCNPPHEVWIASDEDMLPPAWFGADVCGFGLRAGGGVIPHIAFTLACGDELWIRVKGTSKSATVESMNLIGKYGKAPWRIHNNCADARSAESASIWVGVCRYASYAVTGHWKELQEWTQSLLFKLYFSAEVRAFDVGFLRNPNIFRVFRVNRTFLG